MLQFPQYDYDGHVAAHHQLLSEGLAVNHLRCILAHRWAACILCLGELIQIHGCPHAASMPAGADRATQPHLAQNVMNPSAQRSEWNGGDYSAEPPQDSRTRLPGCSLPAARSLSADPSSRDALMRGTNYLDDYFKTRATDWTPYDLLYAVNASRNYDPRASSTRSKAPSCTSIRGRHSSIRRSSACRTRNQKVEKRTPC